MQWHAGAGRRFIVCMFDPVMKCIGLIATNRITVQTKQKLMVPSNLKIGIDTLL